MEIKIVTNPEQGITKQENEEMKKIADIIEKAVKRYNQNAEIEIHLDNSFYYRIELVFLDFVHFDDIILVLKNGGYDIGDMNIALIYRNYDARVHVIIWVMM